MFSWEFSKSLRMALLKETCERQYLEQHWSRFTYYVTSWKITSLINPLPTYYVTFLQQNASIRFNELYREMMEKGHEFFLIVAFKSFYNGGGYSAHKKPFHTGEGCFEEIKVLFLIALLNSNHTIQEDIRTLLLLKIHVREN